MTIFSVQMKMKTLQSRLNIRRHKSAKIWGMRLGHFGPPRFRQPCITILSESVRAGFSQPLLGTMSHEVLPRSEIARAYFVAFEVKP